MVTWSLRLSVALVMTRTVANIQKYFLSSPRYAVVGASKDQSKFGTKVRVLNHSEKSRFSSTCASQVLLWYLERNLSVTPVHPVRSFLRPCFLEPSLTDLFFVERE